MYGCNLDHHEFNQRQSDSSCSRTTVDSCTFSDIHSSGEGGALFISTSGQLEIEGSFFRHCSTTYVAGAMSCKISGLNLTCTCYYDCFSIQDIRSNTFHAVYIIGVNSAYVTDVSQCGFSMCPKDYSTKDETIGFRNSCTAIFKENNFTENLEREEMIGLDDGAKFKGSVIHCNLCKCISGLIVLTPLEATIEKCNIVDNQRQGDRQQLIYNGQKVILNGCVIAHNTHIGIFYYDRSDEIISCFFCGNTFTHTGSDICVPTLKLDVRDAESCKRGSYVFTTTKELALSTLFFHWLI